MKKRQSPLNRQGRELNHRAFSRSKRGLSKKRQDEARIETEHGVLQLPAFVAASNLKPFISKDLIEVLQPVEYLDGTKKAAVPCYAVWPLDNEMKYCSIRSLGITCPNRPFHV